MLRRLPTSRLLLLAALVCAVLGAGTALAAGALGGSGPKPPAKPLAVALHDALAAKPVAGVTARITFSNRLIDSSSVGVGGTPLLSGAKGRLWAAPDGRFRLELQSDVGDAQITGDGRTVTLYDATTNSGYRVTLPQGAADAGAKDHHGARPSPPSPASSAASWARPTSRAPALHGRRPPGLHRADRPEARRRAHRRRRARLGRRRAARRCARRSTPPARPSPSSSSRRPTSPTGRSTRRARRGRPARREDDDGRPRRRRAQGAGRPDRPASAAPAPSPGACPSA